MRLYHCRFKNWVPFNESRKYGKNKTNSSDFMDILYGKLWKIQVLKITRTETEFGTTWTEYILQ